MTRNALQRCLGDRTLGAFLDGDHDRSIAARIDAHVAACATCRSLVALAAKIGDDDRTVERRVCASHLLGASGRRVGAVLKGKWKVDALIGEGGMAEVYSATHRNGRRVAIKVLLPQFALDPNLRSRFVNEGYIANLVDHPGVVATHDDDTTDDGAPFLVMDLLEGETLGDLLERGPLPVEEAVRIATRLLEVVEAAHAKGIVHRDIKPANVFRTRDGGIRLLDFGVARVRTSWEERTGAGALMGTPAFMAPEQARGRSREVDARADVWSVGATLFTMLTGRKVRDAETSQAMLRVAARAPIAGIRERLPSIPANLAAVVDRALAFDRRDRWASAAEFAHALTELSASDGGPISSVRPLLPTVAKGQRRRSRALPIATIAVAVGIIAGALFLRSGALAAELPSGRPEAAEPGAVAGDGKP